MKIYSKIFEFNENLNIEEIKREVEKQGIELLRFAITQKDDYKTIVEAVILEGNNSLNYGWNNLIQTNDKFGVVVIVPTGINAAVGGYIADSTPTVNTLAAVADIVITHPNCVNGSFLNYMASNVLYVEGFTLDKFLNNEIALKEIRSNKIGVIIDKVADPHGIEMVINSIEALRVIAGIDVIGYTITDEPIAGHALQMPSGAFSGEIKNPETLIRAAKHLIFKGATAIAISTHIDIDNMKEDLDKYFKGNLANPFGSVEALISHLISKKFNIPCAHAPILSQQEKDYYNSVGIVDPRASSEVVSPGYLGCILRGLSRAPQISNKGITIDNIYAIIVPYNSCGGIPMLMSQKYNIPLICVRENKTCLNVTPELMGFKNYIIAENYLEAIGIVAAMKAGITVESLRRPFKAIQGI